MAASHLDNTGPGDRNRLGRVSAMAGVTCWSAGNVMVARFDMPGLWIGFWRLTLGAVVYGLVPHLGGRRISIATLRLVAPAASARHLRTQERFAARRAAPRAPASSPNSASRTSTAGRCSAPGN